MELRPLSTETTMLSSEGLFVKYVAEIATADLICHPLRARVHAGMEEQNSYHLYPKGWGFYRQLHYELFRYYQRLLLLVPVLSELRLGTSRVMAFLRVWHYLSRAKVIGDYLEFGVFEGSSFDLSLRAAAKFFQKNAPQSPRFFAFDSFEGLPSPNASKDSDAFKKGEYSATLDTFKKNIKAASKGWEVHIVPGFYDQSLNSSLLEEKQLKKAAFVAVDCDLYSSTIATLNFITPLLQTGTVIYFDDWYYSQGDMSLGEPGACYEWLAENASIKLIDYGNIGIMGKLFIVNLIQS